MAPATAARMRSVPASIAIDDAPNANANNSAMKVGIAYAGASFVTG